MTKPMTSPNPAARVVPSIPLSNDEAVAFLTVCADYFERRPTGGEDAAHWSNVSNGRMCRKIAAMLSAAKPPAIGVDAVVEAMENDPFWQDAPWAGTTQQDQRIRHYAEIALASLSPAATSGSEAGPSCTYCGDTGTITDRVDGEVTCPECGYAKPASSPAGGDVREAFETCAAICEARAEYFDRAPSYREWTDAARSYRATAKEIRERAALSASTSAAEPACPVPPHHSDRCSCSEHAILPAPVAADGRPQGWTESVALAFIATESSNPEIGTFAKSFNEGAWQEIENGWPEFVAFVKTGA